eukprot:g5909.t1
MAPVRKVFRRAVSVLLLTHVLPMHDAQAVLRAAEPDQRIDALEQQAEQLQQYRAQLHHAWQQLAQVNKDPPQQCAMRLQEKDAQLQKNVMLLQEKDMQLHRAQAQLQRVDRTAAPAPPPPTPKPTPWPTFAPTPPRAATSAALTPARPAACTLPPGAYAACVRAGGCCSRGSMCVLGAECGAPAPPANATFCLQRSNMTCVGEPRHFEPQWGASGPFANVTLPPAQEAGGFSKPAFADVDGDNLVDLLLGSGSGAVYYWRNTGSQGSPRFTAVTDASANPFSVANLPPHTASPAHEYSAPSLADVDGDTVVDLVLGSFTGALYYYRNTGSKASSRFTAVTDARTNPFSAVTPPSIADNPASAPSLADVDGDTLVDLLVGSLSGAVYYYRNTGSQRSPRFTAVTDTSANPFAAVRLPPSAGGYSAPSLADVDGDTLVDLLLGSLSGAVYYWRNTGSQRSPRFTAVTDASANPFAAVSLPASAEGNSAPSLADVDGDTLVDLLLGSYSGALYYWRNTGSQGSPRFTRAFGLCTGGTSNETKADDDDVGDDAPNKPCSSFGTKLLCAGGGCRWDDGPDASANPFSAVTMPPLWTCSAPSLADVDGDTLVDLLVGSGQQIRSALYYWRNYGTATAPSFKPVTDPALNPFHGITTTATGVNFYPALVPLAKLYGGAAAMRASGLASFHVPNSAALVLGDAGTVSFFTFQLPSCTRSLGCGTDFGMGLCSTTTFPATCICSPQYGGPNGTKGSCAGCGDGYAHNPALDHVFGCAACPKNFTCEGGVATRCPNGTYNHQRGAPNAGFCVPEPPCPYGALRSNATNACGACPEGVVCNTGFMTQDAGWWRNDAYNTSTAAAAAAAAGTLELYPCFSEACVGSEGRDLTTEVPAFDEQCAEGYTGPVCALCKAGYTRQGRQCEVCGTASAAGAVTVVVLSLVTVTLLALLLRKCSSRFWSRLDLATVKIGVTFFELIAILQENFDVPWPATFGALSTHLRAALASVAELSALACAVHVNRFWQLAIWTLGILLLAALMLARYCRAVRGGGGGSARASARQTCAKSVFFLLLFCYVLVMPVMFSIFVCREVNGVSYLVVDYTLRCDTPEWGLAAAWSAVLVVVYAVGFPVLAWHALRREWAEVAFVAHLFGGDGLQRHWLVVDLLRKLLLSAVILAVPEGSLARITAAVLIATAFLVLVVRVQPFREPRNNRLEMLAESALALIYFLGLLAKADGRTRSAQPIAYGVLLWIKTLTTLYKDHVSQDQKDEDGFWTATATEEGRHCFRFHKDDPEPSYFEPAGGWKAALLP